MNPSPTSIAVIVYVLAGIKILDEIVRLIPDRFLAAHTTVQTITNAIKSIAAWVVKVPPPAVALALLLLASPAFADGPQLRAPMPADVVAVPVVAPEPAPPPTVAEIVTCTAASIPGAIGKCAGLAPVPPLDTRTFTTLVISGSVALIQLGAGLLTIYLNPQPVGK